MPVSYEIDRETGFIRTRCTGVVTFEEVLDHFRRLNEDDSLPAHLDVLLDLTEMENIPESDKLFSVAGEVGRLRSKVKWGACAIVASHDALYGMTRVFHVFAQDHFAHSSVFRTREEALRWLETVRRPGD